MATRQLICLVYEDRSSTRIDDLIEKLLGTVDPLVREAGSRRFSECICWRYFNRSQELGIVSGDRRFACDVSLARSGCKNL